MTVVILENQNNIFSYSGVEVQHHTSLRPLPLMHLNCTEALKYYRDIDVYVCHVGSIAADGKK